MPPHYTSNDPIIGEADVHTALARDLLSASVVPQNITETVMRLFFPLLPCLATASFILILKCTNTCTNSAQKGQGQQGVGSAGHGGSGGSGGGNDGGGDTTSSTSGTCGFESECDPDETPEENKVDCDDGEISSADRCTPVPNGCGGVCAHVLVECDFLDTPEDWAIRCNDADDCTIDKCSIKNVCVYDIAPGC